MTPRESTSHAAHKVVALAGHLPPAPRTVDETGLKFLFLLELVAKVLYLRGQLNLVDLSAHLKLPASVLEALLRFMRGERLCEVARRGEADGDVDYQLTETGRQRAAGFLARSQYAGAAPVSLDQYYEVVKRQSVAGQQIVREDVRRAFEGIVAKPAVLDQFGAAMNSGRPIFLYGPAGSGKTYLAERLAGLLKGAIAVPHAIAVENEVIQLFDPLVHQPLPTPTASHDLDRRSVPDARWMLCRRPVVLTGGELTLPMLDLDFDTTSRFYQAPPQFKANNGIFVVDDLGRQLVAPRELMNRWIVPLDRHKDYLSLHTGYKFMIPFDVIVVFSTNLRPSELADEAFLRRLGYKIHLGPMSEDEYRQVFIQVCGEFAIPYDENAFHYLLRERHYREERPLLACYPRDLVGQVRDFAIYERCDPKLTPDTLDRAWNNYFVTH